MRYDDQARFDPSPLGGRGARPSPALALGGGAGAIVVIVIALLFGVDPGQVLRGGATGAGTARPSPSASCTPGADVQRDRDCRFVALTSSLREYWSGARPDYREVHLATFEGRASTGCGTASSEVGPFYCPADTTVHLELGFLDQLGASGGDAAEAYVLAHAVGHHVQHLTGALQRVQAGGPGSGPRSPGLRLELQADCYAGVWFSHAASDPDDGLAEVSRDDLDRALDTAAAVGADRVQRRAAGQVQAESWAHGSPTERRRWLQRGVETGDPARCDTFAADALR
ncbi:neutral zinc metallopeptidase [Microlunatus lacustris]